MTQDVVAAATPITGLENQGRCRQHLSGVRLENGEQMASETEDIIANRVGEDCSPDQSEYREIPHLNYVNIKRTGVIPEAQYGDHFKKN